MSSLHIIKLGGAAITDKHQDFTMRDQVIASALGQIANFLEKNPEDRILLVHGAGSFAHNLAKQYDLAHGVSKQVDITDQKLGVSKIRVSMTKLGNFIAETAVEKGLLPFPVDISSVLISNREHIDRAFFSTVQTALEYGMMPILNGDMVFDRNTVFRVISGDTIIKYLVKYLQEQNLLRKFERVQVIFGSNVDGIYDHNPDTHQDAKLMQIIPYNEIISIIDEVAEASAATDVTGGMQGKLREIKPICDLGIDVILLNIAGDELRLSQFLLGDSPTCTLVKGKTS